MKLTYGFQIEAAEKYDSVGITARVLVREDNSASPINPRSGVESAIWGAPKHLHGLALDGLGFYAHFYADDSDGRVPLIGFTPKYRDVFSVDRANAQAMVKTLTRIGRALEKADATEPGDIIMATATALRFDFVVERIDDHEARGPMYGDMRWRWMTMGEGRNRLRRMIDENRPTPTAMTMTAA